MIFTLREYAAHLAEGGRRLEPKMVKTMMRGGYNIRDDWRKRAAAKNPIHARRYPGTIVMRRVIVVDGLLTVTVEPAGYGQGKLGQVLEYGRGGARNAGQMSHLEALDAEVPEVLHWLRKIAADTLR